MVRMKLRTNLPGEGGRRKQKSARSSKVNAPQGLRACWRYWRYCMCTAGWYPVLVAPLVSVGFLLSLYSTAGCEFVNLSVGFTPINDAWNESRADLGLFYYQRVYQASDDQPFTASSSNQQDGTSLATSAIGNTTRNSTTAESKIVDNMSGDKFRDFVHSDACEWYTKDFENNVILKDRTWKVSRIMATIALSSSLLTCLTAWLIVFAPTPVGCVWPAVLLPASVIAFVTEGSKFLIFGIVLCRDSVWFPSGVDSLPEHAESCTLGRSSYAGIAAGVLHLIALLCICLKAPNKRRLDPQFDRSNTDGHSPFDDGDEGLYGDKSRTDPEHYDDAHNIVDDEEDPSILDEDLYTNGPSPSSNYMNSKDINDSNHSSVDSSVLDSEDNAVIEPPLKQPTPYSLTDDVSACPPAPPYRVSESRIATLSKVHLQSKGSADANASQDIISQLVNDLDTSFASGDNILGAYP
jgi:hypothetical protein